MQYYHTGEGNNNSSLPIQHSRVARIRFFSILLGVVAAAIFLTLAFLNSAPFSFPVRTVVRIDEGMTVGEAALKLESLNAVRSSSFFKTVTRFTGKPVVAGDYYLPEKEGSYSLARRLTEGDFGMEKIHVTIPEGLSVKEIAAIFERALPLFDEESFIRDATAYEGYLFPDTYSFLPTVDEHMVLETMRENFLEQTKDLRAETLQAGESWKDVMVMASLVEEEAPEPQVRREISGVLWKRIEIGMPLQVDSTFPYIIGKNTYDLTVDDLVYDSPYNTYLYAGLPPGPISNPSLDSISAALHPTMNDYLYYLSDRSGHTYFAKTLTEHNHNKSLYLDQ